MLYTHTNSAHPASRPSGFIHFVGGISNSPSSCPWRPGMRVLFIPRKVDWQYSQCHCWMSVSWYQWVCSLMQDYCGIRLEINSVCFGLALLYSWSNLLQDATNMLVITWCLPCTCKTSHLLLFYRRKIKIQHTHQIELTLNVFTFLVEFSEAEVT